MAASMRQSAGRPVVVQGRAANDPLAYLQALERKSLWLAMWTIHNANHVRPARDGLKVGGHQASSASANTLLTALYFDVIRPEDRIAVKPHASPVFHAIQYIMGRQSRTALERFRGLGGAQAYPSRTKDKDAVDFSTGSVGLGVGVTLFASLVQDYLNLHRPPNSQRREGRMIALMGDAELDEGNVFEALLEGWKHDVRNLWWIIDYNRQSLDGVVSDRLFQKIKDFFATVGWTVVVLKYGKKLEAAFAEPGGECVRDWIDACPNDLYSALTFKGHAAGGHVWREYLLADIGGLPAVRDLIGRYDDQQLHALMTNLAGHDMEAVLEAFRNAQGDLPHCFIAYTIKGFGTPLAGHKDNHAGLMNEEQMARFRQALGVPAGEEWEPFAHAGIAPEALREFVRRVPFNQQPKRVVDAAPVPIPDTLSFAASPRMSTQEAFGRILHELGHGKSELAAHIVTTSPDVTVSTNLGPWVNQRGIFARDHRDDVFRAEKVVSAQKWARDRSGQHIELGIAENNLFLILAALGLAAPIFGTRLLPIGTVYDPFIARGLDALNYACYQDARFMLVATPSGISLAPEGGAHQSIATPLIGLGQPGLTGFEPAYVDELAVIMRWGFQHMQAADGGSVYLRLSTRALAQPERPMTTALAADILSGGYWLRQPQADTEIVLAFTGAVAPEVLAAHDMLVDEISGLGVLAITSIDRIYENWRSLGSRAGDGHIAGLLGAAPNANLITVHDAHPAALSWLGAVRGQRLYPLGVDRFGQSGDLPDLYRIHRIDTDAIVDQVAAACVASTT